MGERERYVGARDSSGAPLWVNNYDEYERRIAEVQEEKNRENNLEFGRMLMRDDQGEAIPEKKRGGSGLAWLGLGGLAFIGPVGWVLIIIGVCVAVWWWGNAKRAAQATAQPAEPPDNGWG
jgi:hypothetical protein